MIYLNRKPKGRKQRSKVLVEYGRHLVYAEGSKTEPLYVTNIKTVINEKNQKDSSKLDIVPVTKSGGRNTLSLIKYAEDDVDKRLKANEQVNDVWIFYDKDSFPKDDFDNSYSKIMSKNKIERDFDGENADKIGIVWHACWSNECFEIWPLLHFSYFSSSISRNMYIRKINNCFKNHKYKKNLDNLYNILLEEGNVILAIKNAKKLDCDGDVKNNPSTGVYKFVDYFRLYLGLND